MDKPKLTENGHTQFCNDRQAKYKAAIAEYELAHPNYCRKCGGVGGFYTSYDPSPPGVSLSPGYMLDYDPCSECVEQGKCPVCGQETLNDDGDKCSSCGWNCEDDQKTAAPVEPDCECWYYEIDAAEEYYDKVYADLDDIDLLADVDREADAFEAYVDGERPDEYGNDPRLTSPGWFTAEDE